MPEYISYSNCMGCFSLNWRKLCRPLGFGEEFGDDVFVGGEPLGFLELFEHFPAIGKMESLVGPEFLHFPENGVVAMQDGLIA